MEQKTPFTGHTIAPHNKRFLNFLIDLLAVSFLTMGLGELGLVLNEQYGFDAFVIGQVTPENLKLMWVNTLVAVVYYGLFESLTQRTLGKYITGTKVVYFNGAKPESTTILLRTLCRQIPFEFLSFLGPYGIGWHDMLSKTLVVEANTTTLYPPQDKAPGDNDTIEP